MKEKTKGSLSIAIVIGIIITGITLGTLAHYGIIESSQISELPKIEEISEKQIMKERLELLKKAAKQDFGVHEYVNDNWYSYRVKDYYSRGITEYVYYSIGGQNYSVEGRGEEVFEVRWERTKFNPQRTLRYKVKKKGSKLKYEANYVVLLEYRIDYSIPKDELSEVEMKELFEKALQHYLEVRKHFGVDTNEGLEKLLEEKTEEGSFKPKSCVFGGKW